MSGLTVTGGQALNGGAPTSRFSAFSGENRGAILNQGNLTLDHVVVKGNFAGDGGPGWDGGLEETGGGAGWGGNGGGIYNADNASLSITDSVIIDNVAGEGGDGGDGGGGVNALGHNPSGRDGGDGGRGGSGGGIFNSNFGSLWIDRSSVRHNFSGRGGSGGAGHQGAGGNGTFSTGGTGGWGGNGGDNGKAFCRGCYNTYTDQPLGGGGVYNLGQATISNSTVSGNGTGAGGNGGPSGPGGQDNASSTFRVSGTAGYGGGGGRGATTTLGGGPGGFGGDGAGIFASGGHNYETSLTHVTIVKNFLGSGGLGGASASSSPSTNGERGQGAGIAVGSRYAGPNFPGVYLKNSLIASNGLPMNPYFDKSCVQQQNIANYQEFGDQGNNLSFPNDGSLCPGLTNVDPDLNLLGSYGGPTETIVPQPGSAAIGAVPLASCTVTTDQRGEPRPGPDGTCDIGAVETGGGTSVTPTSITLNSSINPSKVGQQLTLTATVSPRPSSGTMSFTDGGSPISGCGTAALQPGGQFTCSTSFPSVGAHSIVASYTGNTIFGASTSAAYTQTVNGQVTPKAVIGKVSVTGPSRSKKGNLVTFQVKATNTGDTRATEVKVKATGAGSVVTRLFGQIGAGASKTVQIPVRMKHSGKKKITFRVNSANAGSKTARKTVRVRKR